MYAWLKNSCISKVRKIELMAREVLRIEAETSIYFLKSIL